MFELIVILVDKRGKGIKMYVFVVIIRIVVNLENNFLYGM